MHPNRAFEWTHREDMLRFVADIGFAHVFCASADGLFVVHAPLLLTAATTVQFHVSRRNRVADHLADRPILISVLGRHAYQSANWYASADQVPTWHYEAVEIEGVARPLPPDELVAQLDQLSATFEARVEPEHPWTRAKMDQEKFVAMTNAITGFEVTPLEIRGTRKFNQHKHSEDLEATVAGQRHAGRDDIVGAIREAVASR